MKKIISFLIVLLTLTAGSAGAGLNTWEITRSGLPEWHPYYLSEEMYKTIEDILYSRFFSSEEALARGIFEWITDNIEYGGCGGRESARGVFDRKKGECVGQSRLFIALARAVGLKAEFVRVSVDCYGEQVQHACALVRLDGKDTLVDPAYQTFGANHREWKISGDRPGRLLALLSSR